MYDEMARCFECGKTCYESEHWEIKCLDDQHNDWWIRSKYWFCSEKCAEQEQQTQNFACNNTALLHAHFRNSHGNNRPYYR